MIEQDLAQLDLIKSRAAMGKKMNAIKRVQRFSGSRLMSKKQPLVDLKPISKEKHLRRPSDIDSLSPEVLRALQSTFGAKLNEVRSKIQQAPPASPPPLSPLSPGPPPITPVVRQERSFRETLADREGAHMVIAYFFSIMLSTFILSSAERDDNQEETSCEAKVNDDCARLYGYILPMGLSAIFLSSALILFVFDVSFSLFSILMTIEELLLRPLKGKGRPGRRQSGDDHAFSLASVVMLLIIDVSFIIAASVLLWISKTSTVDPLYIICERRLKLLWMFGLMVIAVAILLSAIKSFKDPVVSPTSHIQTAANNVLLIFCLLILFTAFHYRVIEHEEIQPCGRLPLEEEKLSVAKDHTIQLHKGRQCEEWLEAILPQQVYGFRNGDHKQCPWPRDRRKEQPKCNSESGPKSPQCGETLSKCREHHKRLQWCEVHPAQICDWPRVKQIQPYERADKCSSSSLPQCDWPLAKQIEGYENKNRCKAKVLFQCEWPWDKQIRVYEHGERCHVLDLPVCDWPWLKRIQLFRVKDHCQMEDRELCEWPWVKQIQLYEVNEFNHTEGTNFCQRVNGREE